MRLCIVMVIIMIIIVVAAAALSAPIGRVPFHSGRCNLVGDHTRLLALSDKSVFIGGRRPPHPFPFQRPSAALSFHVTSAEMKPFPISLAGSLHLLPLHFPSICWSFCTLEQSPSSTLGRQGVGSVTMNKRGGVGRRVVSGIMADI